MTTETIETTDLEAVQDLDLELLLEGLDDEPEDLVHEKSDDDPTTGDITELELEAAMSELELEEAIAEEMKHVVEQEVETKEAEPVEAKTEKAKPKKAKAKKTKTLKVSENLKEAVSQLFGDDYLILNKADKTLSDEEKKAKQDEFFESSRILNVKATHKTITVLKQLAGKGTMVNYVRMGIEALIEKKTLTRQELTNIFIEKPLSKGTALSQASQQMFILPILGIAKREENVLTLNEDSTIVDMFSK